MRGEEEFHRSSCLGSSARKEKKKTRPLFLFVFPGCCCCCCSYCFPAEFRSLSLEGPTSCTALSFNPQIKTRLKTHNSGFVWLCSLLLLSTLLLPLAPLTAFLPYTFFGLAAAVAAEALTLRLLWTADRFMLSSLADSARETAQKARSSNSNSADPSASPPRPRAPPPHPALLRAPDTADALTTALAHGIAHGVAHAALLYLSWLPVAAGGKTLYLGACPRVSLFGGGAAGRAPGCLLHCGAALVAFTAWDVGDGRLALRAPLLHAAFAGASTLNLAPHGCLLGLPLAVGVGGFALWEGWRAARAAVLRSGGWRKPHDFSCAWRGAGGGEVRRGGGTGP